MSSLPYEALAKAMLPSFDMNQIEVDGERILIVDDEDAVCRLFASCLGEHYSCVTAGDTAQALEYLAREEFALVIADINMPGLSGIELLRKITERYHDTVVVMVSAIDRTQRVLDAVRPALLDAEEAYSLGLLHDIGRVLLSSLFPKEMKEMEGCEDDERIEREVAAFGVDHAQVGQWVLESCGLPRHLTSFVQTHHDVLRTNTPAALLLHVANAVARADNPFKVASLNTIGTERLYMLRLSRHDLFRIHASLDSVLEQRFTPVL